MFAVPDRFHDLPRYLGYRGTDYDLPYAKYFRPTSAPVQPHVVSAIVNGGAPAELVIPFSEFGEVIVRDGYQPLETGWAVLPGGLIFVSVLTDMPRVKAHMWDWWFGWHGSESQRYKLWCPEAHFIACWADDEGDRPVKNPKGYIGRTSLINEYVGNMLLQGSVRFVDPSNVGVDVKAFDGTAICARVGGVMAPLEYGWLIHQVRNTKTGAEMRSHFYLGQDPGIRGGIPGPVAASSAREGGAPPFPDPQRMATSLVYHCGLEMNNLAQFLPELYAQFGPGNSQ